MKHAYGQTDSQSVRMTINEIDAICNVAQCIKFDWVLLVSVWVNEWVRDWLIWWISWLSEWIDRFFDRLCICM